MRWGVRWRGKRTVDVSAWFRCSRVAQQTESDVSNLAGASVLHAGDVLQLQGRVVPEQDLGSVLDGSPASIDKLLDKDLSKDPVRLLSEDGAEDDRHAVVAGLDVNGLLFAVMDRHDLTTLLDALGRILGRVLGSLLPQLVMFLVCGFERRGHGIALQQGELGDESITFL